MSKKEIELPNDKLGFLLMQASLLKQRMVNSALRELDITYIQFVILAAVLELESEIGLVTQQVISTERTLDKAMVSNVVKSLTGKFLLQREPHPVDNRAYILQLTPEGEKLATQAKEITKKVDLAFFRNINQDELGGILKKLLADNGGSDGE